MLFAAMHESVVGTFETSRDAGGKRTWRGQPVSVAIDPSETSG